MPKVKVGDVVRVKLIDHAMGRGGPSEVPEYLEAFGVVSSISKKFINVAMIVADKDLNSDDSEQFQIVRSCIVELEIYKRCGVQYIV